MDKIFVWQLGGTATLQFIEDDRVVLHSTKSFAPGSRADAQWNNEPVRLKVSRSKKLNEETFEVTGRLVDANRLLREKLKK